MPGPNGLQKGQRFPGAGRAKGTPNRSRSEIQQLIEEACPGWNPLQAMARAARTGFFESYDPITGEPKVDPKTKTPVRCDLSEKTRAMLLKETNEYCYAKRKAVEVGGFDGDPIEVVNVSDSNAKAALAGMMAALVPLLADE